MKRLMLLLALLLHHSIAYPSVQSDNNSKDVNSKITTEKDNESSKKIIGSSVVTSVSVILNGEEPQFTDAVGHRIPKPQVPLQVASPINLLNPDRYEFYTFDNDGQLVKRIMTLQEIHSIVANGDGDGGATVIHNTPIDDRDPHKNVQDIVDSVQNVLTKEVEWKKNSSNPDQYQHQMLDTPDVSSSWSMILPAIFGNTGGDIFSSNNRPQQVVMTPDSDVVEHSTKANTRKPQKPNKRKPITTTTIKPEEKPNNDVVTEMHPTPIPQKIFVNNKEIVKPLFNRNDIKINSDTKIDETTLKSTSTSTTKTKPITTRRPQKTKPTKMTTIQSDTIPEVTTKRITQKRKPTSTTVPIVESTTIKKISIENKNTATTTKRVNNKQRPTTTTPSTTTASTTTSLPNTTKKQKKQPTSTVPSNQNDKIQFTDKVQLIKHKKKPTTTTQTPSTPSSIGTTKKVTKTKQTTTRKPSTTTESVITTSTTITVGPTEKITTELPLSKAAGQLATIATTTTTTTTTTESPNKLIESEVISSSTATIDLMKEKDTTTAALNSIVSSLLEQNNNDDDNDDDMNTKLSFDQIMESLKDKDNSKQTDDLKKTGATKIPMLYNNNNEVLKPMQRVTLKPHTTPQPDMTTSMPESYEKIEMTTYTSPNLESLDVDDANVVKFDPLYAELLDPILTQLTTTENTETTDFLTDSIMTTTLMPTESNESSNKDDKFSSETEGILKASSDENSNNQSSELTQKIDEFIANNNKNEYNEKVYIKLENPETKDLFKQNTEINMKDLQKEIATVASMLEDNTMHTTTINPNKLNNNSDDDEIEALLSDVYNQITNTPLIPPTKLSTILDTENTLKHNSNINVDAIDTIESSNRYTNLAQMSTSILMPPKDMPEKLNSNDKFHLLQTLSLKLNDTNNHDNNDVDNLPIDKLNKINYTNMTDDADDDDDIVNNKIVIEQKNNLTNSNSINLNKNANAIELNGIITTTESILPIDSDTDEMELNENDMEMENENVSSLSSTEYISNETEEDNIFDSTTNNVKVIESLIKTTVQPLIENDIIVVQSTTENPEKLTTISYNNSEIESINDEKNSMEMYKNSEKENFFSNEMTTTIEIDTENNNNNNKFDEITEKYIENSTENMNNMKNDNSLPEKLDITTATMINDETESYTEPSSTEILMELVKLITKPTAQTTEKPNLIVQPTQTTTDIFNITETEHLYIKLGESSTEQSQNSSTTTTVSPSTVVEDVTLRLTIIPQTQTTVKRKPTLKPIHYFKQPISQTDQKLISFNGNQQRPVVRPAALTNLKITQISSATRSPVKLEPSPEQSLGLEASTLDLQEDIQEFARLCNELAFNYWRSITAEKISNARSLVLSPFALTSMLSMVFMGARGSTSGEMNEILRLDDMVTFNPHLVFKNITESVEHAKDSDIASSAFVREIYSDRSNGKVLPFFKEKTQQIYSGHVEEVNFNVVNDIIRRRTNLLIKRHTGGKVMEYLRTNSVWVNGPLSTVTANLFQTNCSRGSVNERDGEMFFQVHPSIRQRRLVPIPAVVWRTGFTAGYDPELDATVVAFGSTEETVSTIYVMPGQHGLAAPGDNLERLERNIMENGISKNVWSHLLTSLMQRPGLEVQLPRFSHRSFVNASIGLQKLGLKALFNSDNADLGGLTGSSKKDIYLSDMIQINTFSTCGEEKISDHHHVEMYPAPPLRKRNSDIGENDDDFMDLEQIDFGSIVNNPVGRGFYDDLLDPKYLELPLPLRPRQARIPDSPRLRFDKPFLYFVRHNPTGMILFMGRFNPRLLP